MAGIILSKFKCDTKPTHVSMIYPKGKFDLPPRENERFYDLYCNTYDKQMYGIAEMASQKNIPVLVDVDLKSSYNGTMPFKADDIRMLYKFIHVEHLVIIYQNVLKNIIQDINEDHLKCFLLEKTPYTVTKGGKTFVKNGFHLHFPFVWIDRQQQENILLPQIRSECKKLNIKWPCDYTPDQLIDKGYCKGNGLPWLMYGSRKDEMQEPYLISGIFDENANFYERYGECLSDFTLVLTDQEIDSMTADIGPILPKLLSIRSMYAEHEYLYDVKKDLTPISVTSNHDMIDSATDPDAQLAVADKLLPLLGDFRAEEESEWIRVGWILYNISSGSEEGYTRWVAFSRRCAAKFDEQSCKDRWMRMNRKDLSIGTLKFMAKKDNPEKYEDVMKDVIRPHMEQCLRMDGTHHDLAVALKMKYDCEFVCASVTHKIWYQFHDHIWNQVEEGITLRSRISSDIVKIYENMGKDMWEKLGSDTDDEMTSIIKKKIQSNARLISRLKSAPYKNNIMREATELFYDPKFSDRLDSNPYLISFQNGVYDIQSHVFREGQPSDYLSLKLPVHYRADFTMDSPSVVAVMDFFKKIFPHDGVRDFFLDIACEIFTGGNSRKIVQVWTGDGDNGKSVTQSLFEQMLGPYSIKLPTSLITGKRTQSSAACPELVRAGNGVRFAVLQEPDSKDNINVGILKELSGNDTFFARGLYREGKEITPMFKLALICNKPPILPAGDQATWNRIRVIPFESNFTDNAPEDEKEQIELKRFPKDPRFSDKIPMLTEGLAWYLIRRHQLNPDGIIVEPDKVKLATTKYRIRNDFYRQFIKECIEDTDDGCLLLMELYQAFKSWYHTSVPNSSVPVKNEVEEYFTKMWGEPDPNGIMWRGKSIRTEAMF